MEFIGLAFVLLALLFSPVLFYAFGWLGGLGLKVLFGASIVHGFNTLFKTNIFTVEMIPVVCGTLAVIGSYFKSTNTTTSK